jgi:hypothetical protein
MASQDEPSGATRQPILPGTHPESGMSTKSSHKSLNEKQSTDLEPAARTKSVSFSSSAGRGSSAAEARESRREVRTLPSMLRMFYRSLIVFLGWVQTYNDDDEEATAENGLLPPYPQGVQVAQHLYVPVNTNKHPGRLHDAARDRTPVMMKAPIRESGFRWREFIDATAYPAGADESRVRVDDQWLEENGGDLETAWKRSSDDEKVPKKWYKRAQNTLLKNAVIPLALRTIVWTFSLMALGLAASIYVYSNAYSYSQRPSTIMAIILDVLALLYILAVTYDEYSGEPIGLRSAKTKMRIILLDLWFIIFDSANLSLAFDALSDQRWGCQDEINMAGTILNARVNPLCHRQEALAGILLIALVAWVLTFSVSVFRYVQDLSIDTLTSNRVIEGLSRA